MITCPRSIARQQREITFWKVLALSGAVSILFGVAIMARPAAGVLAMLYFVAIWAILLGVILVAFAIKARNIGHRIREVVSNFRAH